MTDFQNLLFTYQDAEFRKGMCPLIPNVDPESIIGIRTPQLRALAKSLPDGEAFRKELPHRYFEENQIHAFSLERLKDFDAAIQELETFLPYVNNWATCDQMSPKVFKKHHAQLLPHVSRWISSDHPYTIRFGIKVLMDHFLDGDFDPAYPELVANIRHEDYYVKMMVAWYFATALAKQYDAALPFISGCRLEKWTHNKAIQKSVESYRITAEQKEILKQYRIK